MDKIWVKDTGTLLTIFSIILGYKLSPKYFWLAIVLSLINILYPNFFIPFSKFWLFLAKKLGEFTSYIFFGLVFLLVLLPVGLLRRFIYGDKRDLSFNTKDASAFIKRNQIVIPENLEKTY